MMAFVIIGADIDLSVASVMGLSACVMAYTFQQGAPLPLAIALALASGVLAGLNNAFWIAYVGLPSLAVTLAGLIGYRGVARILVEDRAIGNFPLWFNQLGQQGLIGPLTLSIVIFVILFVFFAVLLHASAFGRLVYVVGSNIEAARYSGVRVRRIKTAMFVGSASVAALAGILYAARLGSVRGDMAEGFRTRRHHDSAAGRGQHFRGQGQSGRRRPFPPLDLESSQRHGSGRHHWQYAELCHRRTADIVRVGPQHLPGLT